MRLVKGGSGSLMMVGCIDMREIPLDGIRG
jgi:hypothetical protein